MLPHRMAKGAAALEKLKCFDGIPFPYDQKKRMVIPDALKCLRLKSRRDCCSLGDLAAETGWTKGGIISDLEDKRKAKSSTFHKKKADKETAIAKA